jgi:glycosyltransferase involved in cell wall biosynthesis
MTASCREGKIIPHELRIAVFAFPFASPAMITPVNKMASIFSSLCQKTYLIGNGSLFSSEGLPKDVHVIFLKTILQYAKGDWWKVSALCRWLVMNGSAQIEMGWHLWRLRKEIDVVLCTVGCYYQIPCFLAKILKKRLFCSSFGADPDIALANHGRFVAFILTILCSVNYILADKIIVDSVQTMEGPDFNPFLKKLFVGNRYVESNFQTHVPYAERETIIGYIGRISKEKGILDFVRALPAFLKQNQKAKVMIIGSGSLDSTLESELQLINNAERIKWIRWADHKEIPGHLNRMRLLVVPSLTEGSPNVILEAMACGTPVLATRVGGIPSLISEGVSGFLLDSATPNDLSDAMAGALENPDIQGIISAGHKMISEEYSFQDCVNRYREILK